MLARGGLVRAGQQGRDPDRGGGLGGDPERLPQGPLRGEDRGVVDEQHVLDMGLGDGKHQLADPPRGQGIRRDAARRGVGGLSRGPGVAERRRALGLDPDHADGAREPGRDTGDQAAAADRHQHRVQVGGLLSQLQTEGALPEDGLALVVGMHAHGARAPLPVLGRGQGVGVAFPGDDQVGAEPADALDFGRRGHGGHEDLRRHAAAVCRVGDGYAMVAAGRRHHPGRRHLP